MENKIEPAIEPADLAKFEAISGEEILDEENMEYVHALFPEIEIRKLQPHEINILSKLIQSEEPENADGAENTPTLPPEFLYLKKNLYAECPDGLGTKLRAKSSKNFDHAIDMLAQDVLKDATTIHYKDCSLSEFFWLAGLKDMWSEGLNLVVVSAEASKFIEIMISALQLRRFPPGSSISLQCDRGKFPYIGRMVEMITKGDFPEDVELKLLFPNVTPEHIHTMSELFASPKCPQGLRVELGNQYQKMVSSPQCFVRTLTGYATYPLSPHEAHCNNSLVRKNRGPVSIREVSVLQKREILIRALMHTSISSDLYTTILMFLPLYINTKNIDTENWAAQIKADKPSPALSKLGLYQEKPSDKAESAYKKRESLIKARFLGVRQVVSQPSANKRLDITFECEELAIDFTDILKPEIRAVRKNTQVTISGNKLRDFDAFLHSCHIIEHKKESNHSVCEVTPRLM